MEASEYFRGSFQGSLYGSHEHFRSFCGSFHPFPWKWQKLPWTWWKLPWKQWKLPRHPIIESNNAEERIMMMVMVMPKLSFPYYLGFSVPGKETALSIANGSPATA